MLTVWKYQLEVEDNQTIHVPGKADPLCMQVVNEHPCIYWLVDPDAAPVEVEVITHGTGHPADDVLGAQYVGTYQMIVNPQLPALVFHVWVK